MRGSTTVEATWWTGRVGRVVQVLLAALGVLTVALALAAAGQAAGQEPAPGSDPATAGETHGEVFVGEGGDGEDDCDDGPEGIEAAAGAADPFGGLAPLRRAELREAGLYLAAGAEGGYLPAPTVATDVAIRVTGIVARARVTQRFTNPSDRWLEGIYVFPLPEQAAVDALEMKIGDRRIEGEVREREEAKQVYEQAKSAGAKASLVEQERPNLFTTSVANVGPGEEVEVSIEYQETADYDAAGFHLRLPTVVAPRYVPGTVPVAGEPGSGWGVATDAVLDAARITPPVSAAPPALALRLVVDLDAGVPLETIASPHHDFDVESLGRERYRVRLADGAVPADRDFELTWTPVAGTEPDAALFTEEVAGDVYALLMVVPPPADGPGFTPLPRETVFVLDTSGSMNGASLEQAKAALATALDRLRPEDSFNVIEFNSITRALFPGSVAADPEAVERARRWVAGRQADGGTEMLPALATALEGPPAGYGRSGRRAVKQVIFITDGAVGNEEALFAAIESMLGEARLFTLGIGSAPNSHFMRRAAEAGRGTFTYIGEPGEVGSKMAALFSKLESPVMTDLEVAWDDPGAEVWPERAPDLYAGEPLVLAARLGFLGAEVRVTGMRDGQPWERRLRLAEGGEGGGAVTGVIAGAVGGSGRGSGEGSGDGFGRGSAGGRRPGSNLGVGKLWARRKIEALTGGLRRGVPADEVRRQVIEVALVHHLVSKYTSLVAVDVTPTRPKGEPLAGGPVPVALPAGSAIPGELPAGGTPARLHRLIGLLLLLPALATGLAALVRLGRARVLPAAAGRGRV